MIAVLLAKNAQSNPEGIPGEWYIDARGFSGENLPEELSSIGYVLMSAEDFEKRLSNYKVVFDEWNAARRNDRDAVSTQKLDALKRLFDDCEAIDDAWATATNAQKFDLAQKTFKILRRQKRTIIDQYRPE